MAFERHGLAERADELEVEDKVPVLPGMAYPWKSARFSSLLIFGVHDLH